MLRETPNQVDQFWKEKEAQYGAPPVFKGFARYLGNTKSQAEDKPGLLYLIGNNLVFEDFEKQPGFFDSLARRNKTIFKKTEFVIDPQQIKEILVISLENVKSKFARENTESKPLAGLAKVFAIPVNEIVMEEGFSYFFEVIGKNDLSKALKTGNDKASK